MAGHQCRLPAGGLSHPHADMLKWTCPVLTCLRTWTWTPKRGWH